MDADALILFEIAVTQICNCCTVHCCIVDYV